ncbi:MAG: class I tRNA ligase family protein, partial [Planctomycetes bacterium]|nr:class I tRNA ligase family protein [Planctomycetota bacterium]
RSRKSDEDDDDEDEQEPGGSARDLPSGGAFRGERFGDREGPARPASSDGAFKPLQQNALHRLLPVDTVFAPHSMTPLRLVATRFITKFFYDRREIPVFEPFRRFFRVGDVVAEGSRAAGEEEIAVPSGASASGFETAAGWREMLERFGADALRVHILGLGPAASRIVLRAEDLHSACRFLRRAWREILLRIEKGQFVSRRVLVHKHRMIHAVTGRLRRMKFHTALAAVKEFVSFLRSPETKPEETDRSALEAFTVVLSPFAPYLAQELWERLGKDGSVLEAPWPEYSEELVDPPEREIPIYVDGKLRDRMLQPSDLGPEKLESRALGRDVIRELIGSRKVAKVVAVPKRAVAIVLEAEPNPRA